MTHTSMWQEESPRRYPAVMKDGEFDVVIVGGGITGLTAAYYLKQEGKRVAVVTKGRISDGETGHTSAHLAWHIDTRVPDLIKRFGETSARLILQSQTTAIEAIELIVKAHQLDCEFRRVPGYLHSSLDNPADASDSLWEDFEAAKQLGFPADFLERGPIEGRPTVRYPDQAIIHPLRYISGLAALVDGNGCVVHEESEVTEIEDAPPVVHVGEVRLRCGYIVVATHVPLQGATSTTRALLFQTKLYPYSTYVLGARVPSGTIEPGLYWDTSDPYYYTRTRPAGEGQSIIFGGADHKTGQERDTDASFTRVEAMLRRLWPNAEVTHRWSGQVIETPDGLPYIGEIVPQQFCATGFAGNGLTFGTIAGLMAADAAEGETNPWQQLFDPSRKVGLRAATEYISENVDYPVHLVTGWLASRRKDRASSIGPGSGAVLTIDGQRVACHRDGTGKLSKVSAVCTHLGCVVQFNEAEQTWDCPCHGSRFTPSGEVLSGPAEKPLARVT